MDLKRIFALCLALFAVGAGAVSADEYVLTAAKWGTAQSTAVRAAGGSVVWSHASVGIGVASSSNPAFLSRAVASRAFQSAGKDVMVQWQPSVPVQELITPGDETFYNQYQWNMWAIEAEGAWANGCGGAGVRVAVIDGGIYDAHADLSANMDKACSASFVSGQPYNFDTGEFWHGTHVAGIIAAADNSFGVIGVAPSAKIIGVKALHGGSGSFGAVIGAILYASDPASFGKASCRRADIINMSLGAVFAKNEEGGGPLVAAMNKAVNFAGSRGVLVVSAAGNDYLDLGQAGNLISVPAQSGSGIAVSATGPEGFAYGATDYRRMASYTNYGEGVIQVAAPGGDFTLYPNPYYVFDMVLSTCRGTSTPPSYAFCFAAGTSMASPAAAGVAALIKGRNPGISLGALKTKLAQTADDEGKNGYDEFYGHGFVNAYRACTY